MKIENNPKSPLLLTALADAARRGVLSPPAGAVVGLVVGGVFVGRRRHVGVWVWGNETCFGISIC